VSTTIYFGESCALATMQMQTLMITGNPQRFMTEYIKRTVDGVQRVMTFLRIQRSESSLDAELSADDSLLSQSLPTTVECPVGVSTQQSAFSSSEETSKEKAELPTGADTAVTTGTAECCAANEDVDFAELLSPSLGPVQVVTGNSTRELHEQVNLTSPVFQEPEDCEEKDYETVVCSHSVKLFSKGGGMLYVFPKVRNNFKFLTMFEVTLIRSQTG
jgi:hypothetical protein